MVDSSAEPAFRDPAPVEVVSKLLPLHAAVYGTLMAMDHSTLGPILCASSLWIAAIAALWLPALRWLSFMACLLLGIFIFPEVPNHGYVFTGALLATALFRSDRLDERADFSNGVRYLAAIVFFWSGVQKVWAGTWSHAQFLAYEIGHSDRFARILGWLANRTQQRAFRSDGPFLGHGALSLASNLVWIAEIIVGIGLLSSRSVWQKRAAWAATIVLFGVEFVARESVFGILVLGLLWPTLDLRISWRWSLLLIPLELLAIGGRLSLVPGGFH